MFFLVGVGLGAKHLTAEAIDAVRQCEKVFLESYTNLLPEKDIAELEKIFGKRISVVGRKQVEENFSKTLSEAKGKNIALLVSGNPLTATTHIQLLIDAKRMGIKFSFVPGISIVNFLGFSGLDAYRFGRTTTIVAPKQNFSPESFFDVIQANQRLDYHTLCLFDYDAENNFYLNIAKAIEILENIDAKRKASIIRKSFLVGFCGVGGEKQRIVFGKASGLKKLELGVFPQCLVVCAKLNEKEEEALRVLL
jgi:diphthine synthase